MLSTDITDNTEMSVYEIDAEMPLKEDSAGCAHEHPSGKPVVIEGKGGGEPHMFKRAAMSPIETSEFP